MEYVTSLIDLVGNTPLVQLTRVTGDAKPLVLAKVEYLNPGGSVSLLAIGVSLLGVVLAVLNLVLDFDYIEKGVAMGAPAKESWRGAFGLTVTMVWLYIEILRLLSYLRR